MSSYVERLLGRTLLAHFKVSPAPASLRESMALHSYLSQYIGDSGAIMHYQQSICPVTKERLEQIKVLLDDFDRDPKMERVHLLWSGQTSKGPFTNLENKLLALREPAEVGTKQFHLSAITRDREAIDNARKIAKDE